MAPAWLPVFQLVDGPVHLMSVTSFAGSTQIV